MSDLFTKYAKAVALEGMMSATIVNTVLDERMVKFAASEVFHTDQRSNSNSELLQDFCGIFMTAETRTKLYDPQGNGQVEIFNGVIAAILAKFCADKRQGMDVFLPHLAFVYNTKDSPPKNASDSVFHVFWEGSPISHRLVCPKTMGESALKIGENAEELSKRFFEIYRHVQITM